MTEAKYDKKSVKYLDENREIQVANYVNFINENYISCKKLVRKYKLNIDATTLQKQVLRGNFNYAFKSNFKEDINFDVHLGDYINYPNRGKKKWISPRFCAVIVDFYKKKEEYNLEKSIEENPEYSEAANPFYTSSDMYKTEINKDLNNLESSIKQQQKSYIKNYSSKLVREVIDIVIDNSLDNNKKIQKIYSLERRNPKISFTNSTKSNFNHLKNNIHNLLVDYKSVTDNAKSDKNSSYPDWLDAIGEKKYLQGKRNYMKGLTKKQQHDKEIEELYDMPVLKNYPTIVGWAD